MGNTYPYKLFRLHSKPIPTVQKQKPERDVIYF